MSNLDNLFKFLVIVGFLALSAGEYQQKKDSLLVSNLFIQSQVGVEKTMKNHAEWITNLVGWTGEVGKTKVGKAIFDEMKAADAKAKADAQTTDALKKKIADLEAQLKGQGRAPVNPGVIPSR